MSVQKWGVFLLLLASAVKAQDFGFGTADQDDSFDLEATYTNDYTGFGDYDDFDPPPCGIDYYDHDSSAQCHHDEFPSETLQDILGSKVKTCCSDHGYIFSETCEVSPNQLLSKHLKQHLILKLKLSFLGSSA